MKPDPRLASMAKIAKLQRDLALSEVARHANRCEMLRNRLDALCVRPDDGVDLAFPVIAEVALRYERWADRRRAALNTELARSLSDLMTAQDKARLAFGRAQVLRKLRKSGW